MRFWCNDAEKDDLPIELPVLEQAPERARAGHDLLQRTIETVYALSPLGLVAPEPYAAETVWAWCEAVLDLHSVF